MSNIVINPALDSTQYITFSSTDNTSQSWSFTSGSTALTSYTNGEYLSFGDCSRAVTKKELTEQKRQETIRKKKGLLGLVGRAVELSTTRDNQNVNILCVRESIKNLFGVQLDAEDISIKMFPLSRLNTNSFKVLDHWDAKDGELEFFQHNVIRFATSLNLTNQKIVMASGLLTLLGKTFGTSFSEENFRALLSKVDNDRVSLPDSVREAISKNFCKEYQRKSTPVIENLFAEVIKLVKETTEQGKLPDKYSQLLIGATA